MQSRRGWSLFTPVRGGYVTIAFAAIVVPLLLAESDGWLLDPPPNADCRPGASAAQGTTEVRAVGTVVRPWLGPHHVYGHFNIPDAFVETEGYTLTISVKGALYYCMWVGTSLKQKMRTVSAEPGRHLVREYVPTRVTLWFLVHGLFGELLDPENWTIAFGAKHA